MIAAKSPVSPQSTAGFTLIELMVVIAILAIAVTFALPEISTFLRRNQIANTTNELLTSFALARTESIKRGVSVTVCSSVDGASCKAASVDEWHTGSVVFVDANANGILDAGEEILRAMPAAPAELQIKNNSASGVLGTLQFAPNGMLGGAVASARMNVSFPNIAGTIEDRVICVARGGRASAMTKNQYDNDPRFTNCGA